MAKLSDMSPDERRQFIYDAYCNAVDCYDPESGESHPSHTVRAWYRAAATGASPDAPERIEGKDDDVPTPASGMDGRYVIGSDGVPRFESSDGRYVVTGDAALVARARQSNPRKVRRMAATIPNYDRLK